jgi:hypothetical protein
MAKGDWRSEVAKQLEQCAAAIRARTDRAAATSLGTAIGYLQQAEENGDRGAAALLAQTANANKNEDHTQRFSFAPGELEQLTGVIRRS